MNKKQHVLLKDNTMKKLMIAAIACIGVHLSASQEATGSNPIGATHLFPGQGHSGDSGIYDVASLRKRSRDVEMPSEGGYSSPKYSFLKRSHPISVVVIPAAHKSSDDRRPSSSGSSFEQSPSESYKLSGHARLAPVKTTELLEH